jgi:hypothetical protein
MTNPNVLFVSEEKLKSFTSIHQSVSPTDLTPYVMQAQDIYLQNFLGATFYQQLQNQVKTNTISSPNRFILDQFIGPMLCNWAMYHAIPFLTYKIFNKSILKPEGENAPSVELDEVKFLQVQVKDVAESYTKQMQFYLKNNPNLYPAWNNPEIKDGMLPDKKSPYFSGLQTNSKYFNWKKYRNYPYGNGETPGGIGGFNGPNDQACSGCGQDLPI